MPQFLLYTLISGCFWNIKGWVPHGSMSSSLQSPYRVVHKPECYTKFVAWGRGTIVSPKVVTAKGKRTCDLKKVVWMADLVQDYHGRLAFLHQVFCDAAHEELGDGTLQTPEETSLTDCMHPRCCMLLGSCKHGILNAGNDDQHSARGSC